MGVRVGDHVALSCPNVPWYPIAYFGILKAGAVVVPLNVMLKAREIAYHLKDSHAKVYLAFEGTPELPIGEMARAGAAEAGCDKLIVLPLDPASPPPGVTTITSIMRDPSGFNRPRREPDDTAVILYTSGTTGYPKGAELTHLNMVNNAISCHDMFQPALTGGGSAGHPDHAAAVSFHRPDRADERRSLRRLSSRPDAALRRRRRARRVRPRTRRACGSACRRCTGGCCSWRGHRVRNLKDACASLRVCASGGAPMPLEVLRGFEEAFDVRVLEGYGLSETAPVVAFNQLQRPSKPGTVGLPIFGVDIRCVDEHDNPVAPGQRGEVVVRGPNIMKGYFNRPDATAEAKRGGWFRTGDIGQFDEDGYLSIVDRKKDMILRGRTQRVSARGRGGPDDASGRRPSWPSSGRPTTGWGRRSRRSSSGARARR